MEPFMHRLRRVRSRIVDDATFRLVNFFQHRHAQSASTPAEIAEFVSRWERVPPSERFAPQPIPAPHPENGPGTQIRRWTFASPVTTQHPENNSCHFDFFPCCDSWARPVMFLMHGLMSASDIGYRRWARRINRRGWHAVFVHLPYHYARRPSGYVSGELAVGSDGIRTVEGVRQAVVESRSLIAWLAEQGVPSVGVWGMSYGGWVAALLAATEPRVRCALLLEPMVDFSKAVWESPACAVLRQQVAGKGMTQADCEGLDRLISPMGFEPVCPRENIAVLAAEFDDVIPAAYVEAFAKKWRTGHYLCCPQGHVGYQLMKNAFQIWNTHFNLKK